MPAGAGLSSAPAAGPNRDHILEAAETDLTRTRFRQILDSIERLPRQRLNF